MSNKPPVGNSAFSKNMIDTATKMGAVCLKMGWLHQAGKVDETR